MPVQVVAGINYDMIFEADLNCTVSESPVTLHAIVYQPLPYTNAPPQVTQPWVWMQPVGPEGLAASFAATSP